MGQELSVVGKRLPRPDAVAKATGTANYTVDIRLPGMLICKVLRSPYPHAKIIKIDKFAAEKLAGVEAVITFKDVPQRPFNVAIEDILIRDQTIRFERAKQDQYVLSEKARFVGDAIAAVAAVSEGIAEEALELIEVEYEKLSAVFDPKEAMKDEAPRVHDYAGTNHVWHHPFPTPEGDIEKGFQEADHIIEETFHSSKQKHCVMEPVSCIAAFEPTGRLTVWSPSQNAYPSRRKIAELFHIPEGMIRWISPHTGGGFGAGTSLRAEPVCITLAIKTGRPVKLVYSREEQFVGTETRHPITYTVKMGVKGDGAITALQMSFIMDAGAYFSHSGEVAGASLGHSMALYRAQNTAGGGEIVYTNLPVSGAFRGFGNPQGMWALEQAVDMAAEKIGMDPLEFRLKNHMRTGDRTWITSIPIENSEMAKCIRSGAEHIGWKEKRGGEKGRVRKRGVGMAIMMHSSGDFPILVEHSTALIKLNEDGSANLAVSPGEIGQNIVGALSQIAAEGIGLRYEDIHVVWGDTDATVFDVGSHASRTCYIAGNAVKKAAEEVKQQIIDRAAKMIEASAGDLEVKGGRVHVKGSPNRGITVREVAHDAAYNVKDDVCQIFGSASHGTGQSPVPEAVFAEVEVDTEIGDIRLIKMVLAHDIGRSINPMTVEGQLEGGLTQGIGYGLTEDYIVNRGTGVLETDNFTSYKIPSALDVPMIEILLIEQPVASGPYGAKSAGESPMNAIAPAIANAVYDAIGIRIKDLPITPEKVLKALKAE